MDSRATGKGGEMRRPGGEMMQIDDEARRPKQERRKGQVVAVILGAPVLPN